MNIIKISTISLGLMFGIASVCQPSDYLHQVYAGELTAHDNKYVVDNNGSITIKKMGYPPGTYDDTSRQPIKPDWQTVYAFTNEKDLHNTIQDLMVLDKEIRAKEKY